MKKSRWLIIVAAGVGLVFLRIAAAEPPADSSRSLYSACTLVCPEALLRGCCDDYCRKPMPCITCPCYGCGVDDYCRKPCPCVPIYFACCGTDCYCSKPCPDLCRPLAADCFACGGWCTQCADTHKTSASTAAQPTVQPAAAASPIQGAGISSANSTSVQPR